MKNITYLMGAGASFLACPILEELSQQMIDMAKLILVKKQILLPNDFTSRKHFSRGDKNYWAYQIGYFGQKGKDYGTIDTYAKKVWLNGDREELVDLKTAVSIFFSIWEQVNEKGLKRSKKFSFDYSDIDSRLVALIAAFTEKGNTNTKIKDNVHFVTWNYDLQLERAFKMFCRNETDWDEIDEILGYRSFNDLSKQICHLNGYHGHYTYERSEKSLVKRIDGSEYLDSYDSIMLLHQSILTESIHFVNHINYAWEASPPSTNARNRAQDIFRQTDVLVIVGYSFPSFNSEIDTLLFNELPKEKVRVIYQDPNATIERIKGLIDIPNERVRIHTETKMIVNPY